MVLVLVAVAMLWAAPAAMAAPGVITHTGTTIKVDFGDTVSQDSLFVIGTGGSSGTIEFDSNGAGGSLVDSADNCNLSGDHVICTVSGISTLVVEMGPGPDFTEFQVFAVPVQARVFGEAGHDPSLWGTERDDFIDGGPGDDELDGFGGDDELRGGPGDDELSGQAETDEIHGGADFDLVDFGGGSQGIRVSLDDVADDGEPGDGDNVHSDVEDIVGTNFDDVIVGSPGSNVLEGSGGHDTIDGAGGADSIFGGNDADAITSRDGLAETIDCGAGTDTLTADDVDVAESCEAQNRSNVLELDVDGDGAIRPLDCDDRNTAIRPGAVDVPDDGIDQDCQGGDALTPDRDHDGVPRPIDCDDGDPRAAPGHAEVRGNRIDEDCNGRAEPFLIVENAVPNAWTTQGAITRNLALGVRDLRKGMKVQVRCRGGGCPFARKSRTAKKRTRLLNLHPLLAGASLRAGARVEVRITRPQAIGKVVRYVMRSGAVPRSTPLCLPPGRTRPRAC
jgi:Putative metal-binding motif/RTX calcium-binding nonapeptide repeat (4 copies)